MKHLLLGIEVKAKHPTTCLNPTATFKIFDAKIETDGSGNPAIWVRGEHTMWFHHNMVQVVNTGV